MKKLINLSLVSAFSLLLLSACATKSEDARVADYTPITKSFTQSKIKKIIMKSGEEHGWKMTEFKSNAVVAENFSGNTSEAVTVHFNENSFSTDPHNDALEDIINDALKDAE